MPTSLKWYISPIHPMSGHPGSAVERIDEALFSWNVDQWFQHTRFIWAHNDEVLDHISTDVLVTGAC